MAREPRRSHLSTEVLLDLLEDRLAAGRRRSSEEHLGLPCAACRERLLALGTLLGKMRADSMEAVPESLRRAAIELFPGAVPTPAGERPQIGRASCRERVYSSV